MMAAMTGAGGGAALAARDIRVAYRMPGGALLFAPPVLIADEPTASLDRASAQGIADLLFAACADSGATLIVITHDAALARRCATVMTLHGGRLHHAGGAAAREAAAE